MATVTTKTADAVLKTYYLPVVADQLNHSISPLLARIRQTTEDVWGKEVKKVVRMGINGGMGAGTEDGDLPAAHGTLYKTLTAPLKNLYGTIEITDKAIRASENNAGAFVNILNDEMQGLINSASFQLGRMLYGDGNGLVGEFSDANSGSTYFLKDVTCLQPGMAVDLYDGSRLIKGDAVILSVNHITSQITLNCQDAVAKGNTLYAAHAKGYELTGLDTIFKTTSVLYGLKRDENDWLAPYTKECETLTENDIQTMIDKVAERANSTVNLIICSWGVRRALFNVLSKYRQTETMELEGGFKAISFNGIPVVADRFCPKGTMYLLNTDDFVLHQLGDWQWLEGEDGSILKQVPGKPVYTATLVKYAELMCYRPCGQAAIKGITEM